MSADALSIFYDARLAFDAGNFVDAIALLQHSLALQEDFKAFELLGRCFEATEREPEALEAFAKGYQLNPQADSVAARYAGALLRAGQKPKAAVIVRSILRRNTTFGPAKVLLDQLNKRRR